jgi:hypothetical protein
MVAPIVPRPAGQAPTLSVAAVQSVHSVAPQTAGGGPTPPIPRRDQAARPAAGAEPSFSRGLIGIAVSSLVCLVLWFAFTLMVGAKSVWVAIGLGALIGWSGQWLGKEKSQRLALAAAGATALVLILGLLWSARHEAYAAVNRDLTELWQERLAFAKEAVKPRSDAELKKFLEDNDYTPDSESEDVSAEIDDKALQEFKAAELPELRKIADGKVSRYQFEKEFRPEVEKIYTSGFIAARAFRVRVLVLLAFAVGAAWKLCAPQ